MHRSLGSFAVLLCTAGATLAQTGVMEAYVPPPLINGLDRNDAGEHFAAGEDELTSDPFQADVQLAWAARLDPTWAAPLYGRALCQRRMWLVRARMAASVTGEPQGRGSAQTALYDSLLLAATSRDPFPDPQLAARLMSGRTQSVRVTVWMNKKKVTLPKEVDGGEIDFSRGQYTAALAEWAKALRQMPQLYWLHSLRAQAFYALKSYDSVVAQLRIVADTLAKMEQSELTDEFDSRAMTLYEIAHTQVQRGDYQAARQAYEEALTVDLGFYMAHARLAGIAFLTGDTATAVTELARAVQLNETDASNLYFFGYALMKTGAIDSAAAQFRKAIAADPYYAAPYEMLGRTLELRGRPADAIAAYQGFIDHAARTDPQLVWNVARVATLIRENPDLP